MGEREKITVAHLWTIVILASHTSYEKYGNTPYHRSTVRTDILYSTYSFIQIATNLTYTSFSSKNNTIRADTKLRNRLQVGLDRGLERSNITAGVLSDLLAPLEELEGGERADAVLGGEVHGEVGVDLDELGASQGGSEVVNSGGDLGAILAPGGPVVDDSEAGGAGGRGEAGLVGDLYVSSLGTAGGSSTGVGGCEREKMQRERERSEMI
jgi:hypothetical protein